jgi:hypothetical protein
MPYARISLLKGKSPEYIKNLSDGIHQPLVESFEVPSDDRFQVIHQHEPYELIFDRNYMGGLVPKTMCSFVLLRVVCVAQKSSRLFI